MNEMRGNTLRKSIFFFSFSELISFNVVLDYS